MKHCIQLDEEKISSMPVGKFFRFTKGKVILDIIISVLLVLLFFYSVPLAKNTYMQLTPAAKVIDIIVNTIIYGVILYPATCFLVIYFQRRRCKEKK